VNTLIAIDPGLSGGIAVSVFGVAGCRPMPATGGDIVALLRGIQVSSEKSGVETVCVMEATSGYAGKAQPACYAYRFGENAGFLKGVIKTLGMRLELVLPRDWQKEFRLGTASACASKGIWKNKLKAEAQRRFPQLEGITLKTADALLILEWALQRGLNHDTREAQAGPADDFTQGNRGKRGGNSQSPIANGQTLSAAARSASDALPATKNNNRATHR